MVMTMLEKVASEEERERERKLPHGSKLSNAPFKVENVAFC
jgi:hypothetical protein